jgi:hypothetical protein
MPASCSITLSVALKKIAPAVIPEKAMDISIGHTVHS